MRYWTLVIRARSISEGKLYPSLMLRSLLVLFLATAARADEIPQKYRETVKKGLEYLAKQQHKDGHWSVGGDQYPTTMTALAGMALLMEGSTIREGQYTKNIRRAADWLMNSTQRNGLISPLNGQGRGYMHDHGYALLFLALVFGEEEDNDRRRHLEDVLTRAVDFTGKAQTPRGGWGYMSSADSGGFDEGSVTVTQVQALRACRNAGIIVQALAISVSSHPRAKRQSLVTVPSETLSTAAVSSTLNPPK